MKLISKSFCLNVGSLKLHSGFGREEGVVSHLSAAAAAAGFKTYEIRRV